MDEGRSGSLEETQVQKLLGWKAEKEGHNCTPAFGRKNGRGAIATKSSC